MTESDDAGSVTAEHADGVLTLRISNPGKRNAFTWTMYEQLEAALDRALPDRELRALVLRGTAEDGFAAGTDIRQFTGFAGGSDGVDYERRVGRVIAKLLAVPVPVIALVQGSAVGAGLVLVACSDVVIAERGARFGVPIAKTVGNVVPAAVVSRLRDRVGAAFASAMLLTSTLVTAEELAPTVFVFRTVEPGVLDSGADELLTRIRTGAPLTIRALKELATRIEATTPPPEDADLLELCYGSDDFREGVTAFLDKRPPVWTGR